MPGSTQFHTSFPLYTVMNSIFYGLVGVCMQEYGKDMRIS